MRLINEVGPLRLTALIFSWPTKSNNEKRLPVSLGATAPARTQVSLGSHEFIRNECQGHASEDAIFLGHLQGGLSSSAEVRLLGEGLRLSEHGQAESLGAAELSCASSIPPLSKDTLCSTPQAQPQDELRFRHLELGRLTEDCYLTSLRTGRCYDGNGPAPVNTP